MKPGARALSTPIGRRRDRRSPAGVSEKQRRCADTTTISRRLRSRQPETDRFRAITFPTSQTGLAVVGCYQHRRALCPWGWETGLRQVDRHAPLVGIVKPRNAKRTRSSARKPRRAHLRQRQRCVPRESTWSAPSIRHVLDCSSNHRRKAAMRSARRATHPTEPTGAAAGARECCRCGPLPAFAGATIALTIRPRLSPTTPPAQRLDSAARRVQRQVSPLQAMSVQTEGSG